MGVKIPTRRGTFEGTCRQIVTYLSMNALRIVHLPAHVDDECIRRHEG